MARQDNPFALLEDDDEGADVSFFLARVEAKMPAVLPVVAERSKQKVHELPSKLPTPTDHERGRGRGGRGRSTGRGGFSNVGGIDAIEQPYNGYHRGYSGESGGGRSRGRGSSRGGMGRARAITGLVNWNQVDCDNLGDFIEDGVENKERAQYGERLPYRYGSRNFVEEKHGKDGEEKEHFGFRDYDGRDNRGFPGYGAGLENREFRDSEGHEERGYGGDRGNRGFRGGVGHEGRSYGGDRENRGFRGGEGRGRVYGARGRRGGRDGEYGVTQYDSNGRWNASETKDITSGENVPIANNTSNENGGSESVDPNAVEEPKNGQLEKPIPEQISSEDTSKVPEEDKEMTLAEYEKLLQEKRKALESLKIQSRKVVLDKDFEGMQVIEKKKELGLIKRSDNDKGKKKETSEREEKARKSLNINEFLKPADVERFRGPASSRGRGGRGRGRGGYISGYTSQAAAPPLEDPSHFPILPPLAKA